MKKNSALNTSSCDALKQQCNESMFDHQKSDARSFHVSTNYNGTRPPNQIDSGATIPTQQVAEGR